MKVEADEAIPFHGCDLSTYEADQRAVPQEEPILVADLS